MMRSSTRLGVFAMAASAALLSGGVAAASGGVTFSNTASDMGIAYDRGPSATYNDWLALTVGNQNYVVLQDAIISPLKPRGAPGVVAFDYDGDGDVDIYATNGPGRANSLVRNNLVETGQATYTDVAADADVDNTSEDNSGACAGDIDNDGDQDLLVLGIRGTNTLFENQGDGTFVDISGSSTIGIADRPSTSCSMGDANGDGLLDVTIVNGWVMTDLVPILVDPFSGTYANQLYANSGGNVFTDVSNIAGYTVDNATITWAVTMVDYDQDGDIDIIEGNDQGGIPCSSCASGGFDHGFIRIFKNDGSGYFSDVTEDVGLKQFGQWMGLTVSDFNADGALDIAASNFGDYGSTLTGAPFAPGQQSSRWFLQDPVSGQFSDPGIGALKFSPFGWGISATDYDNDGDSDIIMNGGMDVQTFVDAPPTWPLLNDGNAVFGHDGTAFLSSDYNRRRNVNGQAIADVNGDGFADVITVANFDTPASVPLMQYTSLAPSNSDPVPMEPVFFVPTMRPNPTPPVFAWNGFVLDNGSLSVELNSADNGNYSAQIDTMGSVGILPNGVVNRDGVGAVVSFKPHGKSAATMPRTAGTSYASQSSATLTFGMGDRYFGRVDILWPGGTRNRLYGIHAGERVTFPEIPCSYDTDDSFWKYKKCVKKAVRKLAKKGVIARRDKGRFVVSALIAYVRAH